MKKPRKQFTRNDYFRALALENLSSYCHSQMLLLDEVGAEELSTTFSFLSSEYHKQAQGLFPLRPHENFTEWKRAEKWKKAEGLGSNNTSQIESILAKLVAAKLEKDKNGESQLYLRLKKNLWKNAEKLIRSHVDMDKYLKELGINP